MAIGAIEPEFFGGEALGEVGDCVCETPHLLGQIFDGRNEHRKDGAVVDAGDGAACVVGGEVRIDRGPVLGDEAEALPALESAGALSFAAAGAGT